MLIFLCLYGELTCNGFEIFVILRSPEATILFGQHEASTETSGRTGVLNMSKVQWNPGKTISDLTISRYND